MEFEKEILNNKNYQVIKNITKDSVIYFIKDLFLKKNKKFITYFVHNNFDLDLLSKQAKFYSDDIEIIQFPEWNTIPYDVNSPNIKIQTQRIEALYKLLNHRNLYSNKKILFLISRNTVLQKIINKLDFDFINFFVQQKISIKDIEKILKENCYEKNITAVNLGEYSINNNTVDLITFDNKAYRILFRENEILSIKSFNPYSQVTNNNYDKVLILPMKEIIFNENNINNFKLNYQKSFGLSINRDALYDDISDNVYHNGCENWLPFFYNNELQTIFDYIPKDSLITYDFDFKSKSSGYLKRVEDCYNMRLSDVEDLVSKNIYKPISPSLLYITDSIINYLGNYENLVFDADNFLKSKNFLNLNIKKVPNFYEKDNKAFSSLKDYLDNVKSK